MVSMNQKKSFFLLKVDTSYVFFRLKKTKKNTLNMSVIHCHGDKQIVVLDQYLFLRQTYANVKYWRQSLANDIRKNFIWKKDLFHVEQPFRKILIEQTKKQKKKNKSVREYQSLL